MGIKFNCPACGRPLNVKPELAGKRGRCPKCQAKLDIPADGALSADEPAPSSQGAEPGSTLAATPAATGDSAAATGGGTGFLAVEEQTTIVPAAQKLPATSSTDAISEAPTLQWYAMPPGSANQYGPAAGEEFRVWMQEGRIAADALVWRQDWPEWRRAATVFPQLAAADAVSAPVAAAVATPLPTAPTATPVAASQPPQAQPVVTAGAAAPAMAPIAPVASPIADNFPITPTESTSARSMTSRGRAYRARSNTGPLVAIIVLLLAMIPLSFFVWKVIREQLLSPPATAAPAGPNQPEE